ncbi:hypothetical protein INT48_009608 [Thamnidium elegans]|uniref:Uncharacterized protein n=1 Tax=Thamnidium elegans TaxID=101142 RepID=A0A8H7VVW6_9FUNG|nr:hypothetical protein INT48_009608 [Thamnidium elegans]
MSTSCEWSILEKLLLTQAVYKYGENMWFQVARVLKQHGLIQPQQRQSDFFSQKNCQFQYYLLVENLEAEKQVYRNNDLKNDMPVVVRIARQLYLQRIEEVKKNLRKDEESFGQLAEEIESIKSGKWDQTLSAGGSDKIHDDAGLPSEEDGIVRGEPKEINSSDSTTPNETTSNTTSENKIVENVALLENRMKRTSSETVLVSSSTLKKCRLEESGSESSENQVISTAISDGNTPKIDTGTIFSPDAVASSEKIMQDEGLQTMHVETPNLQESYISPITFSKSFPNSPQLNDIIPIVDPVTTDTAPVTNTTLNSPEAVNNFTMVTEAIHMINMSNRVTMATEPIKRFETTTEPTTVGIDAETKDTDQDRVSQKMKTENTNKTNDQVLPMEQIVKDSTEKTLINEKLPKIIIPETSTPSYQRTYYDQSGNYP